MSTEGPLIHDGAQCVAAANYFNPASALAGPGGSGQFLAVFVSAARTVTIQTAQGGEMYGILQNTPPLGVAADVGILGLSKAVAGNTFAADVELMVDTSGRLIQWASGAGNYKVGRAIEASGATNQVVLVLIYNPPYKVVT